MSRMSLDNKSATALFLLAASGLFAFDVATEPGIGDGVGYASLLVLTLWMPGRKPVYFGAVFLTVLTLSAYFLMLGGGIGEATIYNRILSVGTIWVIVALLARRKELMASLTMSMKAAQAANAAKTLFLSSMSHELRTPLNGILASSEIMSQELFGSLGSERYRQYSLAIHESGKHLLSLVNDVLDTAQIEAGRFSPTLEPLDVTTQIAKAVRALDPVAVAKEIKISSRIGQGLPMMMGDKKLSFQTLLNIVSNSIKFTPRKGRVEIEAQRAGDAVAIEIRDTGIGIAADLVPALGQPFTRVGSDTRHLHGGAGLGLYLAKSFTAMQGGTFEIQSALNLGTTVRLEFPAAPPNSAGRTAA